MKTDMNERDMLMLKMHSYDFAMEEVVLFLDTHPNDQTALSYFKQYRDLKNQSEKDFSRIYGPVTIDNYDYDLSSWKWIDSPWPWEIGSEV